MRIRLRCSPLLAALTRRPYPVTGAALFSGVPCRLAPGLCAVSALAGASLKPVVSARAGTVTHPIGRVLEGAKHGLCALSAASGGDYSSMSLSARAGLSFLGLVLAGPERITQPESTSRSRIIQRDDVGGSRACANPLGRLNEFIDVADPVRERRCHDPLVVLLFSQLDRCSGRYRTSAGALEGQSPPAESANLILYPGGAEARRVHRRGCGK